MTNGNRTENVRKVQQEFAIIILIVIDMIKKG